MSCGAKWVAGDQTVVCIVFEFEEVATTLVFWRGKKECRCELRR